MSRECPAAMSRECPAAMSRECPAGICLRRRGASAARAWRALTGRRGQAHQGVASAAAVAVHHRLPVLQVHHPRRQVLHRHHILRQRTPPTHPTARPALTLSPPSPPSPCILRLQRRLRRRHPPFECGHCPGPAGSRLDRRADPSRRDRPTGVNSGDFGRKRGRVLQLGSGRILECYGRRARA